MNETHETGIPESRLRRACALVTEFEGYSRDSNAADLEEMHNEWDCRVKRSAQFMATQLGYRLFPLCGDAPLFDDWESEATLDRRTILKWWATPKQGRPVAAAIAASGMTVLDIDSRDGKNGFISLARWEDLFGEFPRTRIIETPTGYQIHMRGITESDASTLGEGLMIKSRGCFVRLPSPSAEVDGYRWLRIDDLEPAPEWLLNDAIHSKLRGGHTGEGGG